MGTPLQRGQIIGRYVVIDHLGSGGMGAVYRAYDPELDRNVALKLLISDPGAREYEEGQTRLVREAQAMAALSHPNVVPVYDAGTFEGQVFVAMELVPGETLASWLDRDDRDCMKVLDVVVASGRGLAAAHEAQLVHRDFKPENVLVGPGDRARVTDFGLVRSVDAETEPDAPPSDVTDTLPWSGRGALATPVTMAGSLVGTPAYMSPEQFLGQAVSPASDQFAFAVTAYEAFYGERPFTGDSFGELTRSVVAGNVRPAPRNSAVPAYVRRALLRALSPDPADRYATMDDLLADLLRDPGRRWRRIGLVAGFLLVAAIATGGVLQFAQQRAQRCRGGEAQLAGVWDAGTRDAVQSRLLGTGLPFAADTWRGVSSALDTYARDWSAMHTEACLATQRGEQSAGMLDKRMACLQGRRSYLEGLSKELAVIDAVGAREAVRAASALPPVGYCGNLAALEALVPPPTAEAASDVMDVLAAVAAARAKHDIGLYKPAYDLVEPARHRADALGYEPVTVEARLLEAEVLERLGRYDEAVEILHGAIDSAERAGDGLSRARAWSLLSFIVGYQQQRHAEGLRYSQRSGAIFEAVGATESSLEGSRLNSRAIIFYHQGDLELALSQHRRALALRIAALGPEHFAVADSYNNMGNVLSSKGELEEAVESHQQALAIYSATLGPDHPDVGMSLANLSSTLMHRGEYEEAKSLAERSLRIREAIHGPGHPAVAAAIDRVGAIHAKLGENDEALAAFERALEIGRATYRPTHPRVAMFIANRAEVRSGQGHHREAISDLNRTVAMLRESLKPEHWMLLGAITRLGDAYRRSGDQASAARHYRAALKVLDVEHADHPVRARALTGLGETLLLQGAPTRALVPLEATLDLQARRPGEPENLADAQFATAQALWRTNGDRHRARTLAQGAAEIYRKSAARQEDFAAVESWLAQRAE